MFRTSSTAASPLLALLTLTATSTLVVASPDDGDTNPRDSARLVHALCGNPSWTLVDTYIALPMLGDDALKASRYPILQRFSPVEGNLSVRSQASVGARESTVFIYLCYVYSLALHSLCLRVTVLLRSEDKCLTRWNGAECHGRRLSQDECYRAEYNLNVMVSWCRRGGLARVEDIAPRRE